MLGSAVEDHSFALRGSDWSSLSIPLMRGGGYTTRDGFNLIRELMLTEMPLTAS
jgi:hypothetical protein